MILDGNDLLLGKSVELLVDHIPAHSDPVREDLLREGLPIKLPSLLQLHQHSAQPVPYITIGTDPQLMEELRDRS